MLRGFREFPRVDHFQLDSVSCLGGNELVSAVKAVPQRWATVR